MKKKWKNMKISYFFIFFHSGSLYRINSGSNSTAQFELWMERWLASLMNCWTTHSTPELPQTHPSPPVVTTWSFQRILNPQIHPVRILASRPWDILLRPSSIKGPPWYSEGSHPHDSWRYPYIWIYGYIYIYYIYIYIYYYIRGSFSLGRWALVVPSMCLALPYICRCRLRFLDRGCSCSFPGHWAGNDADAMNKL